MQMVCYTIYMYMRQLWECSLSNQWSAFVFPECKVSHYLALNYSLACMLIQANRLATEMAEKLAEWSAVERHSLLVCMHVSATVPTGKLVIVYNLLGE